MKKIVWLIISVMMVLSLVLVSCGTTEDSGGKVTEEDTGQIGRPYCIQGGKRSGSFWKR